MDTLCSPTVIPEMQGLKVCVGGHWLWVKSSTGQTLVAPIDLTLTKLQEICIICNDCKYSLYPGDTVGMCLPTNVLIMKGDFEELTCGLFIQSIESVAAAIRQENTKPCQDIHKLVYILIDSPGGNVYHLNRVMSSLSSEFTSGHNKEKALAVSAFDRLMAKDTPNGDDVLKTDHAKWKPSVHIVTYVPFQAASCAFVLFNRGTVRLVRPRAQLLCHVPSCTTPQNHYATANALETTSQSLQITEDDLFNVCEQAILSQYDDAQPLTQLRIAWFQKRQQQFPNLFSMMANSRANDKQQNQSQIAHLDELEQYAKHGCTENIFKWFLKDVVADENSYLMSGVTVSMLGFAHVVSGLELLSLQTPRYKLDLADVDIAEWHRCLRDTVPSTTAPTPLAVVVADNPPPYNEKLQEK